MSFPGGRDRLVSAIRGAVDRQAEERLIRLGLEKAWPIPSGGTGDEEVEFLLGLTPSGEFVYFERDRGDDEWGNKQSLSARSYEEAMQESQELIGRG